MCLGNSRVRGHLPTWMFALLGLYITSRAGWSSCVAPAVPPAHGQLPLMHYDKTAWQNKVSPRVVLNIMYVIRWRVGGARYLWSMTLCMLESSYELLIPAHRSWPRSILHPSPDEFRIRPEFHGFFFFFFSTRHAGSAWWCLFYVCARNIHILKLEDRRPDG